MNNRNRIKLSQRHLQAVLSKRVNNKRVGILLFTGSLFSIAVTYIAMKLFVPTSTQTDYAEPMQITPTISRSPAFADAGMYRDEILHLSFLYPSTTHEVVADGEKEYSQNNNITLPQTFVNLMNYSPPKVLKAMSVRENELYEGRYGKESPLVALSLWVFDNSENLSIQQWYERYYYYPFHWGKAVKETLDQEKPSLIINIDNKSGLGWQTVTPRGYVTYIYISFGNTMMLLENYGNTPSDVGSQIVSTIKFLE